ncbi:MAG TPA: NAD-dependent epimerase/dehydratase family protein [Pirellulaceae bacterium]|jgi:nucleoside-diphosphate-sugar epimerase|nr:NAD-dependent epimerase/dehydratase family protein [Pirellulaceae bacterium]
MKILVTGSSGFVGGQTLLAMRKLGIDAVGLGRRGDRRDGYFVHDLRQPISKGALPHFDAVVHAAARSSPWGTQAEFHADNVCATEHVLAFCRENGLPKLVFLSSSSVHYESRDQFDLSEETPLPAVAVNRYAATKRQAEESVRRYEGGSVILRPRAVFGPHDTVLFPRILRAAQAGRLPLLVRSPPVVGDLIYIENLVDYIVRAATDSGVRGTYLVTNGAPVPVLEFLLSVFAKLGIPEPKRRVSAKTAMAVAGVIETMYAMLRLRQEPPITRFGVHVFAYSKTFDVRRAIADMGPPAVTNEEGVDRFVRWVVESRPYG